MEQSKLPSADDLKLLQNYYDSALKRTLHEYDQRDRDFAMHVTVNGGLFAAVGFAIQWAKTGSPGSWIVTGIGMLLLGFWGTKAAQALVHSVQSFSFWQKMLQQTLQDIESKILPRETSGVYQRIMECGGKPTGPDLVDAREALGFALMNIWRVVLGISVLISTSGFLALIYPDFEPMLKLLTRTP